MLLALAHRAWPWHCDINCITESMLTRAPCTSGCVILLLLASLCRVSFGMHKAPVMEGAGICYTHADDAARGPCSYATHSISTVCVLAYARHTMIYVHACTMRSQAAPGTPLAEPHRHAPHGYLQCSHVFFTYMTALVVHAFIAQIRGTAIRLW